MKFQKDKTIWKEWERKLQKDTQEKYLKCGPELINTKKWSNKLQKHQIKLPNILNGDLLTSTTQSLTLHQQPKLILSSANRLLIRLMLKKMLLKRLFLLSKFFIKFTLNNFSVKSTKLMRSLFTNQLLI